MPKVRTTGFHAWTEGEIEKFERRWNLGTRERLALAIFLYSGLRRGDAAGLGRQHIRDGSIWVRTAKTSTPLVLPILPELQRAIDATPTGDLAFIVSSKSGKPMTKESFGNWFSDACRVAGVPGSAHGLRKAGARRAAENGATQAQLRAIYGWSNDATAAIYIRDADRALLARDGMAKLSKR
ncbi:MAG: tyrosine-type recombinase/integrase [Rhodoblastus sp.]